MGSGMQRQKNFGATPFLGSKRGVFLRRTLQNLALHLLGTTLKYNSFLVCM